MKDRPTLLKRKIKENIGIGIQDITAQRMVKTIDDKKIAWGTTLLAVVGNILIHLGMIDGIEPDGYSTNVFGIFTSGIVIGIYVYLRHQFNRIWKVDENIMRSAYKIVFPLNLLERIIIVMASCWFIYNGIMLFQK